MATTATVEAATITSSFFPAPFVQETREAGERSVVVEEMGPRRHACQVGRGRATPA
jgi:hypothetical protein